MLAFTIMSGLYFVRSIVVPLGQVERTAASIARGDVYKRQAMMRAMVTYLLENGKIETTVTRSKDVRSMAEKMISLGKALTLIQIWRLLSMPAMSSIPRL